MAILFTIYAEKEDELKKKYIKYAMLICFFALNGCTGTGSVNNGDTALESYNKAMFKFNTTVEKNVIRPVAKGYSKVTNQYIRQRITNFFNNLEEPVYFVNHLLQGEMHDSGQNLARFMINTTIGGLGLYDVAAKAGLEKMPTGFDETMSSWCIPDGPYVVLPILGASTPRSTVGLVADGYTAPAYWAVSKSGDDEAMWVYTGAIGLKYLNKYSENLKMIESLEEGSLDYYEAIKSMYMQNRQKIKKCKIYQEDMMPDYDFDMDVDEE